MHLTPSASKFGTSSILGLVCLLFAIAQFGCATGGGGGGRELGSISLPKTSPTKAMQSATAIMARYSYATAATTFPTFMSFQKTGNAADPLVTPGGASGVIEMTFTQIGKDTLLSIRAGSGQYDAGKIKSLLSAIREESQSRAFANHLYGDG
jgi:hypothetical protein